MDHLAHEVPICGPRRVHEARRHGVDPDVWAEHLGQQDRHVVESGLRARIRDRAPRCSESSNRAHVDDRPLRRSQRASGGDGDRPGPKHVDLEDATPLIDRRRLKVVVRDDGGRACVVDQHVEAAVCLEDRVDQCCGCCLVAAHGALDIGPGAQRRGDRLASSHRRGGVHDHGGTEIVEGMGHRLTDPAR